jgi:TRAP-type uncharacterized transport system fused permease subunit
MLLIFTVFISLVLRMGLPATANYTVVSTLMAPVIVSLGAQNRLPVPLIAVHLSVFFFGILADDIRTAILPFIFIFHTGLLMTGTGGWLHLTIIAVGGVVAMTVMLPVANEPTAFSQYSEGIPSYAADLTQSTGATLLG